jgi:hypothetical protein
MQGVDLAEQDLSLEIFLEIRNKMDKESSGLPD